MADQKIITIQAATEDIDVNEYFRNYKYATPEHEPIWLSNGRWLHSYRVTEYNSTPAFEDPDIEEFEWMEEVV